MAARFDQEANGGSDELLLCGAAGTGKTLRILYFLNRICWDYPGVRILIVRKVRADLAQSTLVTYERDIMGTNNPIVSSVQRVTRQSYKYPNKSEIVVGGMDRPGRILSAEYDIIYAAEAVQFTLQDWETFIMRLRSGIYPHPPLIADTNPDRPDHWLKQRADNGMTTLLNTYHKDNPVYYNAEDEAWTERGRAYVLGKLQRLTGVRKKRYLDNLWSIAEGAIYEQWNEQHHVVDDVSDCPEFIQRWRSIDFGYRNPFVCQWWGITADKQVYLYREIYETELLVSDAAIEIARLEAGLSRSEVDDMREKYRDVDEPDGQFWREMWSRARAREPIAGTVADHDREDRATLEKYGIQTIAARKTVSTGIQAVQERLRVDESGRPGLYVVRTARVQMDQSLKDAGRPTSTLEEIPGYVWNNAKKKEEPIKVDDHGVDAMRYLVMQFDDPQAEADKAEMRQAPMPSGRSTFNRGRRGRRGR
jgi:phage terminase large subunit